MGNAEKGARSLEASAALVVCSAAADRAVYAGWLASAGYRVIEAASEAAAVDHLRGFAFPLALAAVSTLASDGRLLLRTIRETNEDFSFLDEPVEPTGHRGSWPLPAAGIDLRALNRSLVQEAFERCGGNMTRAARLLGLSRPALRYRLRKFGLN